MVLATRGLLVSDMGFPHNQGDSKERRTPLSSKLASLVLTSYFGMSRDDSRVLSGHRES